MEIAIFLSNIFHFVQCGEMQKLIVLEAVCVASSICSNLLITTSFTFFEEPVVISSIKNCNNLIFFMKQ